MISHGHEFVTSLLVTFIPEYKLNLLIVYFSFKALNIIKMYDMNAKYSRL